MTANDSKSTPKKAERHPLALRNPYLMDGESEVEMLLHRAWQEGHDAALRAQAEAEGAWRARMNHACLRLDMRARSAASVGHARQAEIWSAAGDIVSEEYRAALAQVGGDT